MKNTSIDLATIEPTQCHLWIKKPLVWDDLDIFVELERYIDESHFIRKLVKCTECGQLYYYEFLEFIDWEHGDDPAYRNFSPIKDESVVEYLNSLSYMEILRQSPRLLFDWLAVKKAKWIL